MSEWKNSMPYPREATAKVIAEDAATLPVWKCHECWKETVLKSTRPAIGRNFKRQVNCEVKRAKLNAMKPLKVARFTLPCYAQCHGLTEAIDL